MPGGGNQGTQGRNPSASTIADRLRNQEGEIPEGDEPPKPPEYLTGEAKKKWNQLAPNLWAKGFLTELDLDTLARYCNAHEEYCIAKKMLKGPVGFCPNCDPRKKKKPKEWKDCLRPARHMAAEFGEFVRGRLGGREKSPYVGMKKEAEVMMNRLMGEFGLSPSSRSRLPGGKTNPGRPRPQRAPSMETTNDPRKLLQMQTMAAGNN